MNELTSSIAEAIKFRATTSLLGTYFIFWLVFHWQALYTTFFVNEDLIISKFKLLKNEYINQNFIEPHFESENYWIGLLVPAILTYLWIWILPNLLFIRAFKRERKYKYLKRSEIINDQIKLKQLEERLAKKKSDIADLELDSTKKELTAANNELNRIKSELEAERVFKSTDLSDEDKLFGEFMKRGDALKVLNDIKECVYANNGRKLRPNGYKLDIDSLVVADTNKLIINTGDYIELTDKGKYFLSKL